jgi:uncharacterized low-complexity protein
MSNKIVKPLTVAIGAAFVGSVALTQMANANTAFQITPLGGGYTLAAEGKCGKGKCAVAKMAKPGETAVTKEEAIAHGFSASQVAAWDKNGDGKLDATELSAMHAAMDKKGKEGSCSAERRARKARVADKKGKEGSCSGH